MREVIPQNFPSMKFDFDEEALSAAINEACEGADPSCDKQTPCQFCLALAAGIKSRLIRAFLAGQLSMTRVEGGNE